MNEEKIKISIGRLSQLIIRKFQIDVMSKMQEILSRRNKQGAQNVKEEMGS